MKQNHPIFFQSFSGKGIRAIPNLPENSNFKQLILSNNPISNLKGLKQFPHLMVLLCEKTTITSFEGVCHIPTLAKVSFEDTPISKYPQYRLMCLIAFGVHLISIDGTSVTQDEIKLAKEQIPILEPLIQKGWIIPGNDLSTLYNPSTKKHMQVNANSNTGSISSNRTVSFVEPQKTLKKSKKSLSKQNLGDISNLKPKRVNHPRGQNIPLKKSASEYISFQYGKSTSVPFFEKGLEITDNENDDNNKNNENKETDDNQENDDITENNEIEENEKNDYSDNESRKVEKSHKKPKKEKPFMLSVEVQTGDDFLWGDPPIFEVKPLPSIPLVPQSSLDLQVSLLEYLFEQSSEIIIQYAYSICYEMNLYGNDPQKIVIFFRCLFQYVNLRPFNIPTAVSFLKYIYKNLQTGDLIIKYREYFPYVLSQYKFFSHSTLALFIEEIFVQDVFKPRVFVDLFGKCGKFIGWDTLFSIIPGEPSPSLPFLSFFILFSHILSKVVPDIYKSLFQLLEMQANDDITPNIDFVKAGYEELQYMSKNNFAEYTKIFIKNPLRQLLLEDKSDEILKFTEKYTEDFENPPIENSENTEKSENAENSENKDEKTENNSQPLFYDLETYITKSIIDLTPWAAEQDHLLLAAAFCGAEKCFAEIMKTYNLSNARTKRALQMNDVIPLISLAGGSYPIIQSFGTEYHLNFEFDPNICVEFQNIELFVNFYTNFKEKTTNNQDNLSEEQISTMKTSMNKWFIQALESINYRILGFLLNEANKMKFDLSIDPFIPLNNSDAEMMHFLSSIPSFNPNEISPKTQNSLLNTAIEKKENMIVRIILSNPNVDIMSPKSALHLAISLESIPIVLLLLQKQNLNINLKDSEGRTPLILAIIMKNLEIVKLLLRHPDILVNEVDNEGKTALFHAVELDLPDIVEQFTTVNGIDANIPFNETQPIHVASRNGYDRCLQNLLQIYRIMVNDFDDDGKTPLLEAVTNNRVSTVRILLDEKRVDVTRDALEAARKIVSFEIIQVLSKRLNQE